MQRDRFFALLCAVGVSSALVSMATAVPYAANVRNTTGTMWEFVLNESADDVTVLRDGGNAVNLGALAAGRHTFDMTGFSTFDIQVSKSVAEGWTQINGPGNPFANFSAPTGVAINKDPSSPYFGTVYVGNSDAAATALGRPQALGVYPLTADIVGVDLTTFDAIADPQSTSQAKSPAGWGTLSGGGVSPYRMTLDDGGNVIVGDWSDSTGGIKYATPDLTSGGQVLGGVDFSGGVPTETGPPGGVYSQESDAFGRIPLHGSIVSRPYVTGTVGVDLTVWAQDEDLDIDLAAPNNDGQSLWRWDVGSATNYEEFAPELIISSLALQAAGGGASYGIPGVRTAAHYDEQHDKWYLTQYRFDGTGGQSGILIVDADGPGPNVVDPSAPNVVWTAIGFTRDPNGDGDTSDGLDGNTSLGGVAGVNGEDVFRLSRDVTTSNDGTKLLIHRVGEFGANPVLGDGVVVIIPLDANGVPAIEVNDNGTPADPADDTLANVETLTITGNNAAHTDGNIVEFDAAGNLYTANSAAAGELLEVFSPGGSWLATTSSNGTFLLEPLDVGLTGDYNGDGSVDAADYVVWRKDPAAFGGAQGYSDWAANYGEPSPGGGASAVPEPGAIVLALVGMLIAGAYRRR